MSLTPKTFFNIRTIENQIPLYEVFGIVNDGTYIYAAGKNNRIKRIKMSDPNINDVNWANVWTSNVPATNPELFGILVHNGYLYVAVQNSGNGFLSKISLTSPNTDYTLNWCSTGGNPIGLAVSGNYMYVSLKEDGVIKRININTVTISDWVDTDAQFTFCIVAHDNYLYVSDFMNHKIIQINLDNPSIKNTNWGPTSLNSNSKYSDGLAVYNGYLYLGNSGAVTNAGPGKTAINKVSLTNPNTDYTLLWAILDDNNIDWITVGGNTLYIASQSTGSILQVPLEIQVVCFKEDTQILTENGYKLIQDLREGDFVKTLKHGYVPIDMIAYKEIHNPAIEERIKDQLYVCSNSNFPEVFEDLVITGCHSILVDEFKNDEEMEQAKEVLGGRICITEGKYRLPACVDNRTTVYNKKETVKIYHIALENTDYYTNYGVYANGLLVETCSKRYLKELSNMKLIH